ncbi:MAG: hypothetical protein AAGA20_18270 [Planctomycetota bacterium]
MRSLFTSLALLILGVALGFALARSLEVDATKRSIARAAELATLDPPQLEREEPALLEPEPASDGRDEIATTSFDRDADFDAAVFALLDRLPRTEGDGVVSGRALDDAGDPIARATVIVSGPLEQTAPAPQAMDSSRVGRAYEPSAPLDPVMSWYARQVLVSIRRAGRAQTSSDGSFRVDGLGPGSYSVQAYAMDFQFDPAVAAAGAEIELLGRAVTTFELAVVRPDGLVPEEAMIVVRQQNGQRMQYRWTPDSPTLRVTSWTATVQALVGDVTRVSGDEYRAAERSTIRTLDRAADGPGPHRLEVVGYPSVRVDVVPGPDAGQPFEPWCDLVRDGQRISVKAKDGAPFVALDVTAGPYAVEVGRGDGPAEATRDIVVDEGRTDVRIELGPLDPTRYLVVTCVDTSGRPIQDVSDFGVSIRMGRRSVSASIRTKARPRGEYWLSLERWRFMTDPVERSEITSLELTARSASRGSVSRSVDPAAERFEFLFETPCELVVEVVGVLDARLRARVEAPPAEGQERWQRVGDRVDVPGDGAVAFTALAPGTARVVVFHEDSPFGLPLAVQEVELAPGPNRVRVEVTATHDLVVLVPDRAGEPFELLQEVEGSFKQRDYVKAGDDERIVFEGLPPGRYRVRPRTGLRNRFAEYDVPCAPVVYQPVAIGGYEVVALPDGSPAATLGLRLGDILLKVDGVDADAEMFLAEFTSRTMRDEGALLLVRRAGKVIEVPARFDDGLPARGILGHGARFEAQVR